MHRETFVGYNRKEGFWPPERNANPFQENFPLIPFRFRLVHFSISSLQILMNEFFFQIGQICERPFTERLRNAQRPGLD